LRGTNALGADVEIGSTSLDGVTVDIGDAEAEGAGVVLGVLSSGTGYETWQEAVAALQAQIEALQAECSGAGKKPGLSRPN
jgi:hypothetical protein